VSEITTFVGLDVHKDSTAIAKAETTGRDNPVYLGTVGPDIRELLKALKNLGKPEHVLVTYEAGPCGYELARQLHQHGYPCEVIAPNKIPRSDTQRLKTDRRDAMTLARLARSGDLIKVLIPDESDESIRDLTRAREDAVRARLKARQQLNALLLRHGHRYTDGSHWTAAHERYLANLQFPHPAQYITFAEYLQAAHECDARVTRITEALRAQTENWRLKPVVHALMTLRGIDFVAAVTVIAELGDLRRFAHPRDLMGFLGLIPSEYTTGDHRRQGEITRSGNGHARRILVEAAWNYRFPARISGLLYTRQEGQPQAVCDIAWKAQQRLCHRFRRLRSRQLHQNKICVAIARELAGFIWDIARQVTVA